MKRLFTFFLLISFSFIETLTAQKPILLIVAANGYEPTEFGITRDMLLNPGKYNKNWINKQYDIKIASNSLDANGNDTNVLRQGAHGMDGSFTHVDYTLEQVNPRNFAGVFFIGGPLSLQHLENNFSKRESYRIAHEARAAGIPLGAISFTPRILVRSGVLTQDVGTGYPGREPHPHNPREFNISSPSQMRNVTYQGKTAEQVFADNNVAYVDPSQKPVVFANNASIITSVGRDTSVDYAAAIITLLDLSGGQ